MRRKALLVDLDGTLFTMGDRSPYDVSRCGLDTVNPVVHQVMKWAIYDDWAVVLGSGRGFHEKDRYYTEQALLWNEIEYDYLAMRKPGDDRPDHVVKRELYELEIEPSWDTALVLDDRKSVVNMWRHDLELPVFQVDDRLDHEQDDEAVRLRAEVERLTQELAGAREYALSLRLYRDNPPRTRRGIAHG